MIQPVVLSPEIQSRYPLLSPDASRQVLLVADEEAECAPAYTTEGVSQIPVPVFRWKRGQSIDQTLLDLQMHLLSRIHEAASDEYTTLTMPASAYIRVPQQLPEIPKADMVCFGLWVDPSRALHRRVFCMPRRNPSHLDFVLEHPTVERLSELATTHLSLMDSGLWLMTDKARAALKMRALSDLIAELNIAIVPLAEACYYPFTTTRNMVRSTSALQNAVQDQRLILQHTVKTVPSLFTQNARVEMSLTAENRNIWIENSHTPASWTVSQDNVITGVPVNDWQINFAPGQCLRVLPIGEKGYAATVYPFDAVSSGTAPCGETLLADDVLQLESVVKALLDGAKGNIADGAYETNLDRLKGQRQDFLRENLSVIARNHRKSVFYQVNLRDMAQKFASLDVPLTTAPDAESPMMVQVRDAMFRSQLKTLRGEDGRAEEQHAFNLLKDCLTAPAYTQLQLPHLDVYRDQIVWGRSAVRIDVAGGWTDTPPFCFNTGGNVVNLAIELNGQQPLQVYVKPCKELKVICRSIDLGAMEVLESWDELSQFNKVGSPFSIPKAALALCGFLPQFCKERYATLTQQLEAFGCGIEITLLSAIPAGSGLGTSSILAATVLGALSDFCGLGWDKTTICNRTLILEQLLTTGGGWQDQYGGVLHGVKLLQTGSGFDQTPVTRWLPDQMWRDPEMRQCHLLYYTGLTRTAKHILAEIVRGMFLNNSTHITLLGEMKQQALDMFDAIQRGDIGEYGRLVRRTWSQNKALDAGTEPPLITQLCAEIDDLCTGYKLPGAGGGGYLYMVAKDPEAAARIKHILQQHPLTDSSRFVDMTLSHKGLQVSRS